MFVDLDASALAGLLEKVADFSLVLDRNGRISELAVSSSDLQSHIDESWIGTALEDGVVEDSRARVREQLAAARANPQTPTRLDVIHQLDDGGALPVQYRILAPGGEDSRILALGRDMRPDASLRQQLMNAQQALEADYWRLRQVETRYRQLFDMVVDAILVVDAASGRILEANPAANELLGGNAQRIVGKPFPLGLAAESMRDVGNLLTEAQAMGRAMLTGITLADDAESRLTIVASFLRQGTETRYLVRLAQESATGGSYAGDEQYLPPSLQRAPDGVLLTDTDGRVLSANKTFLDLAQVVSEDRAVGLVADRWVGRSGVDLSVLLSNLRERASVKLFSTILRGESGVSTDVEISACSLDESARPSFAFFIRDVSRRVSEKKRSMDELPATIEQITQRVGRLPLKELVRESTDIIEAMCIRAALELTQDNRASAAELLGLSRQSLYAKLRRYDITGVEGDPVS